LAGYESGREEGHREEGGALLAPFSGPLVVEAVVLDLGPQRRQSGWRPVRRKMGNWGVHTRFWRGCCAGGRCRTKDGSRDGQKSNDDGGSGVPGSPEER